MATDDKFEDEVIDEEEGPEEEPRPKTSTLTIVLCALNVLAAAGFTVLLVLDFKTRQSWSHAVFMHDLQMLGLPLREEWFASSASRETMPKKRLDPEKLKEAHTRPDRGGKARDQFQAVEEVLQSRISPEYMTPEVRNELFQGAGEPVTTLEEEIERLKKVLPEQILQEAQRFAAGQKTDAAKRQQLEKTLLPLAYTVHQVKALYKKIQEAPADRLEGMLIDAAQRRMLVDILEPLERLQPGEIPEQTQNSLLQNAADFDSIKLERLTNLLQRRLDSVIDPKIDPSLHFGKEWTKARQEAGGPADLLNNRESMEKRRSIAFLLVVVAHVKKPGADNKAADNKANIDSASLLDENGPKRAQVVVGLFHYAKAMQDATVALLQIQDRVLDAIRTDREAYVFNATDKAKEFKEYLVDKTGKPIQHANPGFIDQLRQEIVNLQDLAGKVKHAEDRLVNLKEQSKKRMGQYNERNVDYKKTLDKLVKARAETTKMEAELQILRDQLFAARKRVNEADLQNQRLEGLIRKADGSGGHP